MKDVIKYAKNSHIIISAVALFYITLLLYQIANNLRYSFISIAMSQVFLVIVFLLSAFFINNVLIKNHRESMLNLTEKYVVYGYYIALNVVIFNDIQFSLEQVLVIVVFSVFYEFLFRGYLLLSLKEINGTISAIIVTSICYALLLSSIFAFSGSISPVILYKLFLMSIVFSVCYLISGSMYLTIYLASIELVIHQSMLDSMSGFDNTYILALYAPVCIMVWYLFITNRLDTI